MALTQSARIPGPSWDDEVVPALRKRLESESRTLAKRISAISLSSSSAGLDEAFHPPSSAAQQRQPSPLSPHRNATGQQQYQQQQQQQQQGQQGQGQQERQNSESFDRTTSRVNGHNHSKPAAAGSSSSSGGVGGSAVRARTYSSPYGSDFGRGSRGAAPPLPRMNGSNTSVATTTGGGATRSTSPRFGGELKPTRIPKPSRPPLPTSTSSSSTATTTMYPVNGTSNGHTFIGNGIPASSSSSSSVSGGYGGAVNMNTDVTHPSPDLAYQPNSSYHQTSTTSGPSSSNHRAPFPTSYSTQSTFDFNHNASSSTPSQYHHRTPPVMLQHESPPFPTTGTDSSMSGYTSQPSYSNSKSQQPQRSNSNNNYSYNYNHPSPTMRAAADDLDLAPPRSSVDSEEQPFEHWYRGEVSRNGGVGELRVGRRQEMLDIANYGHLVDRKRRALADRIPPMETNLNGREKNSFGGGAGYYDPRYDHQSQYQHQQQHHHPPTAKRRKRADSIGGVTDVIRERGSLYLDDDHANAVGRVLDEHPLTDLEGEASDVNSLSDQYATVRGRHRAPRPELPDGMGRGGAFAYIPQEEDVVASGGQWSAGGRGASGTTPDMRSTTPTPNNPQAQTRSASRQTNNSSHGNNLPPTRIPGPSSRRSSESRSTSASSPPPPPNSHSHPVPPITRGASEPLSSSTATTLLPPGSGALSSSTSSSSSNPSRAMPPTSGVTPVSGPGNRQYSSHTVPASSSSSRKGPASSTTPGASPNSKAGGSSSSRTAANKATRAKLLAAQANKKGATESNVSVAQYPSVDGDEEDMAYAIPSWTQPVPKEGGNWDEVVLPVVARKKGLDDQYEQTDGLTASKKTPPKVVAPAPGTFGYDHTKYRQHPNGDHFESIPMDEFGRPERQIKDDPSNTDDDDNDNNKTRNDADQNDHESTPLPARGRNPPSTTDHAASIRPTAPSPAPFSQYAPVTVNVREKVASQPRPVQDDGGKDEHGGGCCKCIIM